MPAITATGTVAQRVRQAIHDGTYPPGSRLPTERALGERWAVSRRTVRDAYHALVNEGLVISRHTRGYFVRGNPAPLVWRASDRELNESTGEGPQDSWARCVREQGRVPVERISIHIVRPDPVAMRYLQLSTPEALVVRRRLRWVDDEPSSTADSFYLRRHVVDTPIAEPEPIYPGVYAVFAAMGLPWVETVDEIVSRAPTPTEAAELEISGGVQVTELLRVSFAHEPDGGPLLPVRLTRFVLPGDRHIVQYRHRGEAQQ